MNIESNIASFNATLSRYMAESSKTPDEVLDKKGRDLGIKIFQGFSAHKFGGPGKKRPGLAQAELEARTSSGEGTRVRPALVAQYLEQRAQLRSSVNSFIGPRTNRQQLRTIKDKVKLWQSFVGREVKIRQSGIGALAASFLWFRGRSSQAKGKYYVPNRTGHPIGYVERGDGFLRIVGLTLGLSEVNIRYGIVATALAQAEQDMEQYITERYSKLFGGAAA